MRKILLLVALLVGTGMLVTPFLSQAATYKQGDTVTVTDEVTDDLYVSGGTVTVTKPVLGDVWAGAGMLNMNAGANVGQDLNAAGGQVWVNSNVADDIHIAGGNVTVNSEVGDNLMIFGGTGIVTGTVKGDMVMYGGTLTLDGTVEGNLYFKGGQLTLGENTKILGNMEYTADEEVSLPAGAVVEGAITYTAPEKTAPGVSNNVGMFSGVAGFLGFALPLIFVISLVALFLLTLVVVFAAPKKALDISFYLRKHLWRSLGWGVVYMIVVPIVALILMVLLVTFPIGILVFLVYGIGWLIAAPLLSFCVGTWFLKLFNKKADFNRKGHIVLAALLGAIIYSLVVLIPFVGGFIIILGLIFTLGALFQVVRPLVFKKRDWDKGQAKVENPEM